MHYTLAIRLVYIYVFPTKKDRNQAIKDLKRHFPDVDYATSEFKEKAPIKKRKVKK